VIGGWRDTPARATLGGVDQSTSRKRDVRLIVGAGGISVAVALVGLALYRRPLPSAEPELAG
jgi:hypothetical protein